jgi:hypothetical protein
MCDARVGMKIMLTDNIATELGLANGTACIFHRLLYAENERDDNVKKCKDFPGDSKYITNALYALVEIVNGALPIAFDNLPRRFVPIPVRSKTFNVDVTGTSLMQK